MKNLRAVLAVALASAACAACGARGEVRRAEAAAQASPSATPAASGDDEQNGGAVETPEWFAHDTGEVTIVPREVVEKDARARYEINVSYPQISGPKSAPERRFNAEVRALVEGELKAFKDYCAKSVRYPNGEERVGDYSLETRYEVLYATADLLSVNLTIVSFTGYLNSDYTPVALNYDLRTGRRLKLAGLFKPRSNYLEALASESVAYFERHGLGCSGAGVKKVDDPDWLRRGTKPEADNYAAWSLTRDGLLVNFGEYQIAPGCAGLRSALVPYERLRELLRPGGPLGAYAARPGAGSGAEASRSNQS